MVPGSIVVPVGWVNTTSIQLRPLRLATSTLPPEPGSASVAVEPATVNVMVAAALPAPTTVPTSAFLNVLAAKVRVTSPSGRAVAPIR
jgi:hypothetical protein